MTKKYLKIRPLDTLFFRTGKPFSGGEVSWTESSLLPNPSVLWGAIYSMLITHNLVDFDALKSNKTEVKKAELEKLKLGRVFLYDGRKGEDRLYLPVPLDTYYEKETEANNGVFKLVKDINKTLSLSNYLGNTQYKLVAQSTETIQGFNEAFIDSLSFYDHAYLQQQKGPTLSITAQQELIEKSHKVGIKRENQSHTAAEVMLYRINSSQFKKEVYFIVEVEVNETQTPFPTEGLLKLGGEGRGASFTTSDTFYEVQALDAALQKVAAEKSDLFRLYLYSSTFFESGTGLTELQAAGFEVLAACLGKGQAIGGFDVLNNQPKAMQKAVPSGSVYFLKTAVAMTYQESKSKLNAVLKPCSKGFGLFEILPLNLKE